MASAPYKNFRLIRISYTPHSAFGVLLDGIIPFCVTLERPWLENKRRISCIPHGIYMCYRVSSPKFGNTFEITEVPERSHILFHKGNLSDDTHGCVLLGERYDPLGEKNAILSSGKAFVEFKKRTKDMNNFTLRVEVHR